MLGTWDMSLVWMLGREGEPDPGVDMVSAVSVTRDGSLCCLQLPQVLAAHPTHYRHQWWTLGLLGKVLEFQTSFLKTFL